jgi:hypothetical protein
MNLPKKNDLSCKERRANDMPGNHFKGALRSFSLAHRLSERFSCPHGLMHCSPELGSDSNLPAHNTFDIHKPAFSMTYFISFITDFINFVPYQKTS